MPILINHTIINHQLSSWESSKTNHKSIDYNEAQLYIHEHDDTSGQEAPYRTEYAKKYRFTDVFPHTFVYTILHYLTLTSFPSALCTLSYCCVGGIRCSTSRSTIPIPTTGKSQQPTTTADAIQHTVNYRREMKRVRGLRCDPRTKVGR